MSQELPVNNFILVKDIYKFDESFTKSYNEESDKGYFLEVDIQYSEKLTDLHNNLAFLPERMKIEKVEKPVANLHDKAEYFKQIRNLKQPLNHGLVLKKLHRIIKFNPKAWLKLNTDINTDLRKKAKNDFKKDFSNLMSNVVF